MLSKEELVKLISSESVANTIRWKTPTSIMIGFSPLKLADKCISDEKSKYATVKVFNPTEHRYQEEKVRVGKILGVVLRGGNIYGWASQPYKLEKKIGEYSLEPKESGIKISKEKSKTIIPLIFHKLATVLMENTDKKVKVKPMFDNRHIRQLAKIIENPEDRVLRAVNRAVQNAKGVEEFSIICRMYGGGRERTAVTFKYLYEIHGISEVPEQWGNGISVYSKETENMLVGAETALDGQLYYFRLHQKDIPKYT